MSGEKRHYRAETRRDYWTVNPVDREFLQTGALLRIADAAETMAQDHDRLIRQARSARKQVDRLQALLETEKRRSATYKGQANRLRAAIRALGGLDALERKA